MKKLDELKAIYMRRCYSAIHKRRWPAIEKEIRRIRTFKKDGYWWHIHHQVPCEITADIHNRVFWIVAHKEMGEILPRLKALGPVKNKKLVALFPIATNISYEILRLLHEYEYPKCKCNKYCGLVL